ASPGVDLDGFLPSRPEAGKVEIAFAAVEERGALRLFLRALRRLPADSWRATVWTPRRDELPPRVSRSLRERVRFVGPSEPLATVLSHADIVCMTSTGPGPAAQLLLKAIVSGVVPVASRIPVYEEVLRDGQDGLLFER